MLVKPKETPVDSLLLKRVELLEQLIKGQEARLSIMELRLDKNKNLIIPII